MRLLIGFILLFPILGVFAQGSKGTIALADPEFNTYFFENKPPAVSGKIINATKEELSGLSITYSLVTPFAQMQVKRSTPINGDGSFKFILNYPFPFQQIWFNLGDYFYSGIYANKGLDLELDLAQLKKQSVSFHGKGIKYLGKDGPVTDWMNRLLLYKRHEQLAVSSSLATLEYKQKDYLIKLDSLYKTQKRIEDEFINKYPSAYSWIPENERLSGYYASIMRYSRATNVESPLWEKIRVHTSKLVSNSASGFNRTLFSYTYFGKSKANDSAFNEILGVSYADALRLTFADSDIKGNEKMIQQLVSVVRTPWTKVILKEEHELTLQKLNEIKEALKSGVAMNGDSSLGKPISQLPFGAKLYTVSNTKATHFLAKLSAAFKGKAIILDFWATWCAPCLADMPYSMKLHEEAVDLPLEFVYLCTSSGSNQERWQSKVAELKQSGIHIFIDEKLTSELMEVFGKGGFPSYVCLDQSGEVSKSLAISSMTSVSLDDVKKLVSK